MKNYPKLGIILLLSTAVVLAAEALSPISVALGPTEFAEGDALVVDQVLASSPKLEIGDRVLVRGRYTLASQPEAKLGLSLTRTQSRAPVRISPGANMQIARGSGDFELIYEVTEIGCMRVALSNLTDGKSFGTIYFGTPEQLARVKRAPQRWLK
jgi:hypothetical protein